MTSRSLAASLALLAVLAALLITASPARASADVSIQGYRVGGGGFVPIGDGGTIPVGATLEIRVWVDLYGCDPVIVTWGDGAQDQGSYGGSFAQTFTHTYAAAGTYTIRATEPCGGAGAPKTINVGGGGALFDPSSELFFPTIMGLILGLMALAMALGGARLPLPKPTEPAVRRPRPRPRLVPGAPPSMVQHLVSWTDIPIGARRLPDPRIPIVPGVQTDVLQQVACPRCGGRLGYVAPGWFCLNPQCR